MGLCIRWWFYWIAVAVHWTNAYVAQHGGNAPGFWGGFPMQKSHVPAPPHLPFWPPAQGYPYTPFNPYAPPTSHQHFYQHFQYPFYQQMRNPFYQAFLWPYYMPAHTPASSPSPPTTNPLFYFTTKSRPWWVSTSTPQPKPPQLPPSGDGKPFPYWTKYFQFPQMPGYYMKKPSVMPAGGFQYNPKPYLHQRYPPMDNTETNHEVKGHGVLQEQKLPRFQWSRGQLVPQFQ